MSTLVARQLMPVFTPSAVSGEHLESITVGREFELQAIHGAFKAAATTKGRPNVLLVGPRGSGKSHLISVALHRLSLQPKLRKRLAVVWLPEDVYTITSYRDLIRTMIKTLEGTVNSVATESELEEELRRVTHERVIVLVAENFDRTMNLLGEQGQRSLRALQHNSGALMILASMPSIDAKLFDHSAPFYGQFRVLHLDDLSVEQGRELLIKTAQGNDDAALVAFLESPTGLARLRAVEHLAGGSPRLWLLVSGLMTVELLDELVPLFTKLLDELTPYFKARMDELAPAKAKILATICGQTSSQMSVRKIAEECGMSQQTASKQLHELERDRFVRKTKSETDKRSTYYELREPLLRYVLELKSNQGEPLSLIVTFLAAWYTLGELWASDAGDDFESILNEAFVTRVAALTIQSLESETNETADRTLASLLRIGDAARSVAGQTELTAWIESQVTGGDDDLDFCVALMAGLAFQETSAVCLKTIVSICNQFPAFMFKMRFCLGIAVLESPELSNSFGRLPLRLDLVQRSEHVKGYRLLRKIALAIFKKEEQ
jgi:DNA-binding MarR family transcriptional regulator